MYRFLNLLVALLLFFSVVVPVHAANEVVTPRFCFFWKLPVISALAPKKYAACHPRTSEILPPAEIVKTSTILTSETLDEKIVEKVDPLVAGRGISIDENVIANTGIVSLQAGPGIMVRGNIVSNSGILSLVAGNGIAVEGNKISNTGIQSIEAGSGMTVDGNAVTNNDKGSSQSIFKNISISGQNSITADSNNDTLAFAAGEGISLITDTSTNTITIEGTAISGSTAWNSGSGVVSLSSSSNDVALGGTTSLGKLSLYGDANEKQMVIRGYSTQTANLLELQSSGGTAVASFNGNGALSIAQNQGITLTANNSSGGISRLITLRATTAFDRPWISHLDYTGRHGAAFGLHHTNATDGGEDKTWEIKTAADPNGSIPAVMLTRFAIEYDTDLSDVIFGDIDTIGVHNDYGDRIEYVARMRNLADTDSITIGQWITELGAADSTVMSFDPLTMTNSTAATMRLFRETNTSGQKRFVIHKGDGTASEAFAVNAGTGVVQVFANNEAMTFGDETNTRSFIDFSGNRAMTGYDGSYAVLQGGPSKGVKLNVGASSFGQGTALTILPTGEVGIGTTSPSSLFSVGTSSQFQVSSGGAVAAATGISSSGTITFSSLNTAGGILTTNGSGVVTSIAGDSGQCLVSNGTSAPSWQTCATGSSSGGGWNIASGTLSPINSTLDVLIGGTSTTSAKFAFMNVNSGTPTASFSGNIVVNSGGSIQSTNNQTLTIGGNTTGNIILNPVNGSGRVGIGTSSPTVELDVFNSSSPELRLSKSTGTYLKFEKKSGSGSQLADVANTGESLIDLDPITSDGTSKSSVRLFRSVNTSDTGTGFSIYAADGTSNIQSFFSAKGSSYFNALAGNFGVGTSSPTAKFDLVGTSSMSATLAFSGNTSSPKIDILNGNSLGVRTSGGGTAGLTEKFTVLNNGNVGIGTTNPTLGPLEMASGAYVTSGGTWTNSSDRNLKTNFSDINVEDVLQKITLLPLTEWNYINENNYARHIGPMAQDFHRIFGLGNNDKSISTIDPSGVALAGIQGLHSKFENLESKVNNIEQLHTYSSEVNEFVTKEKFESRGNLLSLGKAFFHNVTTFFSDTIFKGRVAFEKTPEFSRDTAGVAIVTKGADKVLIEFDQEYASTPMVNANVNVKKEQSITQDKVEKALFEEDIKYVIVDVSTKGFTIQLNKPASDNLEFSWMAIAVLQPKVSVGKELVSPIASDIPAASISPSPVPTLAPTASPLISPAVTPSPSPFIESESSAEASSAAQNI